MSSDELGYYPGWIEPLMQYGEMNEREAIAASKEWYDYVQESQIEKAQIEAGVLEKPIEQNREEFFNSWREWYYEYLGDDIWDDRDEVLGDSG